MSTEESEPTWRIHDEQNVGSFGRGSLRRVSVDLADGNSFDQYVIQLPRAVLVAAVSDDAEVLLMRRYRFVIDPWVWEMSGGYIDWDESSARRY